MRSWMSVRVLCLFTGTALWIGNTYQQVRMERALIDSIEYVDFDSVEALLHAGADPNATDSPEYTDWQIMCDKLHSVPAHDNPTALFCAMEPASNKQTVTVALLRKAGAVE